MRFISISVALLVAALPQTSLSVPVYWDVTYTMEKVHYWDYWLPAEETGLALKTYGYFSYDDETLDTVSSSTYDPFDTETSYTVSTLITEGQWGLTDGSSIDIANRKVWYADPDNGIDNPGSVVSHRYVGSNIYDGTWDYMTMGAWEEPAMSFDYAGDETANGEFIYRVSNTDTPYGSYVVVGDFVANLRESIVPAVPIPSTIILFTVGLLGLSLVGRQSSIK